jgi:Zn finger protein HypA/HybF involved in hydrogenase expression
LADVLVEGSSYSRKKLKLRLYETGLKQRSCELCGQGEVWRGKPMALILDHVNGVPDDNRLENLRIVCPNCNSTFDTHCGRKNRAGRRDCRGCGRSFSPRHSRQKYCSAECGSRQADRVRRLKPVPSTRRVERPSHEQLLADVASMSMLAVGRKYGVSDNAVRKWLRWYRQEAELEAARLAAASRVPGSRLASGR